MKSVCPGTRSYREGTSTGHEILTIVDITQPIPDFAALHPGYILDFPHTRLIFLFIPPRHEGRFAIVTIRGAGCGGAAASGASNGGRARSSYRGRVSHHRKRKTDHAVRGIAER